MPDVLDQFLATYDLTLGDLVNANTIVLGLD